MTSHRNIVELFQQEPGKWGMRGDRYLWLEMAEHFAQIPIPVNAQELHEKLEHAFAELTGGPISSDKYIFVERHSHGGMSGGCIFPEFWRDHAIPLLKSRAYELCA